MLVLLLTLVIQGFVMMSYLGTLIKEQKKQTAHLEPKGMTGTVWGEGK